MSSILDRIRGNRQVSYTAGLSALVLYFLLIMYLTGYFSFFYQEDQYFSIISGFVFDDVNGNGVFDVDEPILDNVNLNLFDESGLIASNTSGLDGSFRFVVDQAGIYFIEEVDPDYWFSTTPNGVEVMIESGYTQRLFVNFGDKPFNASIKGVVFNDSDFDGVQEPGEDGIPGVEVRIYVDDNVLSQVDTDVNGSFSFILHTPGIYKVLETDPGGWESTTDNLVIVEIGSILGDVFEVSFGDTDAEISEIVCMVFNDTDADGVKGVEERGILGVSVEIYDSKGFLSSQETGPDGVCSFSIEQIGEYRIVDAISVGWINTTRRETRVDVRSRYDSIVDVTFGETLGAIIFGKVYHDVNEDSTWGIEEDGLEGINVSLRQGEVIVDVFNTGKSGNFSFLVLEPGIYQLNASDLVGWSSTTPNNVNVTIELLVGQKYYILFGDNETGPDEPTEPDEPEPEEPELAVIYGFVFHDTNSNEKKDFFEKGIFGVTISLYDDEGLVAVNTSDSDGSFRFSGLEFGVYEVEEIDLSGWYSVTRNLVEVTLEEGVSMRVDFADNMVPPPPPPQHGSISGLVFDDLDGDGEFDLEELGLEKVMISLYMGDDFITSIRTSPNGAFSFSSLTKGRYTVVESDQAGMYSTTSNIVDLVVSINQVTSVRFGDREYSSIEGHIFNDTNGDGRFDVGEESLTGINVSYGYAGGIIYATTDENGRYLFENLTYSGLFNVTSDLPDGYFRTTPSVVFHFLEPGDSPEADFGYALHNSTFGVVYGTVFEDKDHNGTREQEEVGISEVLVQLFFQGELMQETMTDLFGRYSLRSYESGQHDLVEFDLSGFISTTLNQLSVSLDVGSDGSSPVDFGDFYGSKIMGMVFEDSDVDGVRDVGETGLAGAIVSCGGDSIVTSSIGNFTLYVAGTGVFNLEELNPQTNGLGGDRVSYLSTNAIPGSESVSRLDADTLLVDIAIPGKILTGNDFGDVNGSLVCEISGLVFDDANTNGQFDVDEVGLTGATVALSSGMAQTSGIDGTFLLYCPSNEPVYINASFYINGTSGFGNEITSTIDENYIPTNAIPGHPNVSKVDLRTLMVLSGSNETYTGNMFGIVHVESNVAVVSGHIYYDGDENGVFDTSKGDFAVPELNVTMVLHVGDVATNEIWIQTDLNGSYRFAVIAGTTARITSTGPESHYPTSPESVLVHPPFPGVYPDNDFGYSNDTEVTVVTGLVYYDWNSDGERDLRELGLTGANVSLFQGNSVIDNVSTSSNNLIAGTFMFRVNETGLYRLNENNPVGFWSTTPDQINVIVDTLGQVYFVEFGDTNRTDTTLIYGSVFNDIDGDGVWGIDELGIPGVSVSLEGVIEDTTDVNGGYSFTTNVTGVHTVKETDRLGYISTTPNEVQLDVNKGNSYEVNFGDILAGEYSMDVRKKVSISSTGPWLDYVEVIAGEDLVWYNITVTNKGEDILAGIVIWDDYPMNRQISVLNSTLAPWESMSTIINYTAEYGYHENRVDVSGSWDGYTTKYVDNHSSAAYTGVLPYVNISIEKRVSSSSTGPWHEQIEMIASDGIVYYNVTVSNTGEFPLDYVTVEDSFGPLFLPVSKIMPGQSAWVTYSRLAETGYVINIASASGTYYTTHYNYSVVAFDFDSANYTGLYPSIVIDKQVYGLDGVWRDEVDVLVGETVWYRFIVENSGSLDLSGIYVVDDVLGTVLMPKTSLEVGESMVSTNVSGIELAQAGYHDNMVNVTAFWNKLEVFFLDTAAYTGLSYATISGTVYNDANATEAQEPGEDGLSGVTVTLYNGTTFLISRETASDGSYSFLIFETGNYSVIETNLAGWYSTTPNEINVTISSLFRQDVEIDFGDIQVSERLIWNQWTCSRGDNYTSPVLEVNRQYRIEASHQFQYNTTLDGRADAMYYSPDGWNSYYPTASGHSFMQIDGGDIAWGVFNVSHVYSIIIEGAGVSLKFQVVDWVDNTLENNGGSLRIRIYRVFS